MIIELLDLPKVNNMKELSNTINITEFTLYKITRKPELYYKKVEIPKNSGKGTRILACPSYRLKAIQAWILRKILNKFDSHRNATAYNGRNLRENAQMHLDNQYVLCVDIKNFFPSTNRERIYNFFKSMGYNKQVAIMFTKFTTFENGLPQGGVTSPALSNLVNKDLDIDISDYCNNSTLTYTRYADDITVSSNNKKKLKEALEYLKKVLNKYGYTINSDKTRILQPGIKRKITGLIYNEENDISIGRNVKRLLRAKIHKYEISGQTDIKLRFHIDGWFSYLNSVDPKAYGQLSEYWIKLQERVSKKQIAIGKQDKKFSPLED